MSTEFAISRFLVPELAKRANQCKPYGWALFMDCDVLVRGSLSPLFAQLDDEKAVYCVKHNYTPALDIKMDGQSQTVYPRKNWSSVMAINVDHPANNALTVEMVNGLPGRDLHAFCWLDDDQIGELGPEWNWLVGETQAKVDPKIVHFTQGYPGLSAAFENVEYADEWFTELERWAA
jgi:lipopolysaccharide biosynthesis glycosyltransferase